MDPIVIAIIALVVAWGLVFLDVFVPSGGALLVLALVAGIVAVLFGFRSSSTAGLLILIAVLLSIPASLYFLVNVFPHTPVGQRLILSPKQTSNSSEVEDDLNRFVGTALRIDSAMLPAGQVRLGGQRFNAMAESGIIEGHAPVEVVAVKERILVLRPISEADYERLDKLQRQRQAASDLSSQASVAASKRDMADVGPASELDDLLNIPAEDLGIDLDDLKN